MDTLTLLHCLSRLLCRSRMPTYYVVAKNEPDKINFEDEAPYCAIINTEPNYVRHMGHWCCLIVLSPLNSIWFESYGGSPSDYGIQLPLCNLLNISKSFQSNFSLVCGLYCLELCVLVSRGYSYKHFLSLFSIHNKLANDKKTIQYFKKIKLDTVKNGGQICSSKIRNLRAQQSPV